MKIMKSFLLITSILLGSFTLAWGQNTLSPTASQQEQDQAHKASGNKPTKLILVTIDFGSPLYHCLLVGICDVNVHVENSPLVDDRPNPKGGTGLAGILDNKLIVWFESESITPENLRTHFPNDIFTVQDPYELKEEALKQLGIEQYTIKPGKYPVKHTQDGKLMVTF